MILKRQSAASGFMAVVSAAFCAAWSQTSGPISLIVQAENFSAKQGGTYITNQDQNPANTVWDLGNGNWLRWDNVNFLDGQFDSISLYYYWDWTTGVSQAVRFRIDSPTATPIASITNFKGGAGYGYVAPDSLKTGLTRTTGLHSLYLTVEGSAKWLRVDRVRLSGTFSVAATDARTYCVATNGSDANDGLSIDSPFKTIQKAASVMKPGSVCRIRQGVYRETIRPAYTGFAGAPLAFEAYNGENVVVSGADLITGWTVHSGSIYKAPMRWSMGEYHDQVLVDGKMAWIARCPNVDDPYASDGYVCWGGIRDWSAFRARASEPSAYPSRVCFDQYNPWGCPASWVGCHPPGNTPFQYSVNNQPAPNALPQCFLGRATDCFKGGLITIQNHVNSVGKIVGSIQETASRLTIQGVTTTAMFVNNQTGPGWLSHVFELLDSPNEWFRKDSTLYLWAPDGGDPSRHCVEAKKRLLAFDLRSKQYVNLTGLRVLAAAVSMEDAVGCTIDRCHFKYLSHFDTLAWWDSGPGFPTPPWNPTDGSDGIFVGGSKNTIQNSSVIASSGAGIVVCGKDNIVTNCIVKECNYWGTGQGAITTWARDFRDPNDGCGTRISHNTLKYNSWSNVCVGWQAQVDRADDERRIKIEYNDFGASSHYSQENGSLTGRSSQFVEVSHNWFHGVAGGESGDIVMEFDMGARHWALHHNVSWQGRFTTGECATYVPGSTWFVRGQSWTLDFYDSLAKCFNNTIVDSNAVPHRDREEGWPGWAPLFKNNLMAKSDTTPWKFTDAVNRDFTLRAGSPAIDKGVTISGWLTTFNGSAPDLGAYEYGGPRWVAGADWQDQPWVYPPSDAAAMRPMPYANDRGIAPQLRVSAGRFMISGLMGRPWRMSVCDMKGACIATRSGARMSTTTIDLRDRAGGVCVIRLTTGNQVATWKTQLRK
jgi:hypothetical protein